MAISFMMRGKEKIMGKRQYLYDVEMYSTLTKKLVKRMHKQVSGVELKKFRMEIKKSRSVSNNREIRIYKTIIEPSGKKMRNLHDKISFGIEDTVKKMFQNKDFHCCVELDYDYNSNCFKHGCDSICRCSTIENVEVSVSIDSVIGLLVGHLTKAFKPFKLAINPDVLEYCLERVIRHSGLNNPDCYDVCIEQGYYGEEIESVNYMNDCDIINEIVTVAGGSSVEAISYVLEQEYGYLLKELKHIEQCEVKTVSTYDINVPNEDHYRRLDKDIVKQYKDYEYPLAVCIERNGKYRLLDGYHRYQANNKRKKCSIVVVK